MAANKIDMRLRMHFLTNFMPELVIQVREMTCSGISEAEKAQEAADWFARLVENYMDQDWSTCSDAEYRSRIKALLTDFVERL